MCTDGVIEARDESGEQFGFDRFDEIIQTTPDGDSVFDCLKRRVYEHMGQTGREDDITLVETTMVPAGEVEPPDVEVAETVAGSEDWKLVYELGPRSLRSSNPLPLLQHVVMEAPQLRRHAGEIYTVLAELYSNALEHGLMNLDSTLKSTASGFTRYYQARAEAMEVLEGFVRFEVACRIDGPAGELVINVADSGPGFDFATRIADEKRHTAYHGRGVRLLKSLCQSLEYKGAGNQVEVVFAWCDDDELASER
jgi:hypothetical protein